MVNPLMAVAVKTTAIHMSNIITHTNNTRKNITTGGRCKHNICTRANMSTRMNTHHTNMAAHSASSV